MFARFYAVKSNIRKGFRQSLAPVGSWVGCRAKRAQLGKSAIFRVPYGVDAEAKPSASRKNISFSVDPTTSVASRGRQEGLAKIILHPKKI